MLFSPDLKNPIVEKKGSFCLKTGSPLVTKEIKRLVSAEMGPNINKLY